MPKKRSVKRHLVVQPLEESYRLIPLTQNKNAIVDIEDYEWLMQWDWQANRPKDSKTFYAKRGEKTVQMHNAITGWKQTDHKNGNGLDNRRKNLRPCTASQNNCNREAPKNNSSGFKGVHFAKHAKKWMAQIVVKGEHSHLGYFNTPEEAARAYDEAAERLHGEFAHLNFPH